MPLVKIVAKETVPYSLDNGINMTLFDPGKEYKVPKFAAEGMVMRGWAVEAIEEEAAPPKAEAQAGEEPAPKGKRRSS